VRRRIHIRAGAAAGAAGRGGGLTGRARSDGPPSEGGFQDAIGDRGADATHGVDDSSVRVGAG